MAAYSVQVFAGNPTLPLTNFSFYVTNAAGHHLPIGAVCASTPAGAALGVWTEGGWVSSGHATSCSPAATCPVAPGAVLQTDYVLDYYLGPSVGQGVPAGTYFGVVITEAGGPVGISEAL